jgi:hypothetical protein
MACNYYSCVSLGQKHQKNGTRLCIVIAQCIILIANCWMLKRVHLFQASNMKFIFQVLILELIPNMTTSGNGSMFKVEDKSWKDVMISIWIEKYED